MRATRATPNDAEREAFDRLLGIVRARVDERLASWLGPRVAAACAVSAEVGAAARAIERLSLRGGKRMRAALVAAAFDACGGRAGREDSVDDLAALDPAMIAVELLQVYLLIHDDWMDDDDVRRGGPAVHVELRKRLGSAHGGDSAAILAGDLACAYAQQALLETPLPDRFVLGAARAFAGIQAEVVTGQLAEMKSSVSMSNRESSPSPTVEEIHALKTASYTVTGPLTLGALLAGATETQARELAQFGRPLGVAFQLRDDLLGVFGDPSATGKPIHNDIRRGKRTALVAELRGDAAAEALFARVASAPDASADDVLAVVRAMETTGARVRVEARVEELLGEARDAIDAMDLPGVEGRAALRGALRALGERSS